MFHFAFEQTITKTFFFMVDILERKSKIYYAQFKTYLEEKNTNM